MTLLLTEAVKAFLDHCRIAKSLSNHTLRAYEGDLGQFAGFAGREATVSTIERDLLRDYARHLFDREKLKETSVRRKLAALKVMFRWLETEEIIEITPFHRLQMPIRLPKRLPKALAPSEIRDLLLAARRHCSSDRIGRFIEGGASKVYKFVFSELSIELYVETGYFLPQSGFEKLRKKC